VPFKGIVTVLNDEINAWHAHRKDGRRAIVVNGDVTQVQRNRIFQDYRDDPSLTELVCHPRVMAHGLNLTQADLMVFYAPIYSNEESIQVMDRINRPGQTRKMTIVRIVANTLERDIYAMVEGRAVNQESILSLYKKQLSLC
jgi:SNF2 family DNA or RNA helicase